MTTMLEQRRKKRAHNPLDDLPENCIFDILFRLPLETLCSSRFVCKSWFEIISSPDFRNAHLHGSDTTTARGLIFLTMANDFMRYMKFKEFKKDGKSTIKEYNTAFNGKITAACNGLIVLKRKPKTGLILRNPVTREDEDIPLGTISYTSLDFYGLAFCHVSRRYKLLHLFMKQGDKFRNLGCEIMDVGSGSWRAVDVPRTKCYEMLENPIFAMGALHWVQHVDDDECMVSMPLDDEKFKTMAIPDTGGDYFYIKSVFAMGEFLGFSGGLERGSRQFGVWILRGLGGEYGWEKQYNFDIASGMRNYRATLLCYGGEVNGYTFVFKCGDGRLYACDDGQMTRIDDIGSLADTRIWRIFAHVNSLVTWRS